MNNLFSSVSRKLASESLDNDVVVSSRIRLARNLKKYPFPAHLEVNEAMKLWKEVADVLEKKSFDFYPLKTFSVLEKQILVEKHLISQDLVNASYPALLLSPEQDIAIMLNEEDHLRIQGFEKGLALTRIWEKLNNLDDELAKQLDFAYHETYGYLTSCPSNVGTGLRASAMLHLPLHDLSGESRKLEKLGQYGVAIRGAYGEGSKAIGHFYQVSNQHTLGKDEKSFIETVQEVVKLLVERERQLRKELADRHHIELVDKLYRAYGLLTNARLISEREAIENLSLLRLGYSLGIFKNLDYQKIDEAILVSKNAYVNYHGSQFDHKNKYRADKLREIII